MSFIYWSNTLGNDANDGLSQSTPVASVAAVEALRVANPTFGLKQHASGTDYTYINQTGSSTITHFAAKFISWENWTTDGLNKPVNVFPRSGTSTGARVAAAAFLKNIIFKATYSSISGLGGPSLNNVGDVFVNCEFINDLSGMNSGSVNSWIVWTTNIKAKFFGCNFLITERAVVGSGGTSWKPWNGGATTTSVDVQMVNCKIKQFTQGGGSASAGSDISLVKNCVFEFVLNGSSTGERNLDIPFNTANTIIPYFINNTVIINPGTGYTSSVINGMDISSTVPQYIVADNVFINNTDGDFYVIDGNAGHSATNTLLTSSHGNNLLLKNFGVSSFDDFVSPNITLIDYNLVFGSNSRFTVDGGFIDVPFLSMDYNNANFGKYDIDSSTYQNFIKDKSKINFNGNLGADTNTVSASSGYPLLPLDKVAIGYDRGDGQLGTYAALERYTDIPITWVTLGEQWRYNSLTNNRTGDFLLPSDHTILSTVNWGFTVSPGVRSRQGSYVAVGISDVRAGVTFGASSSLTGVLNLPAIADVRAGVTFDNATKTGLLNLPAVSDVRFGISFDNNTKTGLLNLPAIGDVRVGVTFDNATKTGLLNLPVEADVKAGVSYDNATKLGTYDPITGFWEAVSAADLRAGVSKLQNGVLVNGLLDLPVIGDVKVGVIYDNGTKTGVYDPITGFWEAVSANDLRAGVSRLQNGVLVSGLLDLPVIGDVRSGVSYDNNTKTGLLNLPAVADVRFNVSFDNNTKTGLLNIPSISDVRSGVSFDNATKTGTLDVFAEANLPAIADVRSGTAFGNGLTGTLNVFAEANLPIISNVRLGVEYGNGLIGTLDISAEANLPNIADVRLGVTFGAGLVGTLNIFVEANLPSIGDVRSGVVFGNAQTGTLDVDVEANHADETEVLAGVVFGSQNQFTGRFVIPLISDVKAGVQFGVDGTSLTGTYELDLSSYPVPAAVAADVVYAGGLLTGILGKIDLNNMDISYQIRENALSLISNYLVGWTKMNFPYNIDKHNFKTNLNKYDVIIGGLRGSNQNLYGQETLVRTYTVKLMTRFVDKGQNESGKEAAKRELILKMEEIRRRGVKTKWGNFGNVMHTTEEEEIEVSFGEDGWALCELTYQVYYSVPRV